MKYDYSLSKWFASSEDRVIPGVSFLFLTKMSFVLISIYYIILNITPYKLGQFTVVGTSAILTLLIIYGFQKTVKNYVYAHKLAQEYKDLRKEEIILRNFIGLTLLIVIYLGTFFIGVKMIGGYLK